MKIGAKSKLIASIITTTMIVGNFVFAPKAFAAVSSSAIVSMTNSARVQAGLKPYKANNKLNISAYAKAQDIIENDYFAHFSPSGKSPWLFIKNAGYSYTFAGENLAINFNDSKATFNAWMNSPTHKSNILDKDFTEIGVAVLTGDYNGRETTVIVQHFGTQPQKAQVKAVSTKAQTSKVISEANKSKIDLSLNIAPSLILNTKKETVENIVWYSSPALYLIKPLI